MTMRIIESKGFIANSCTAWATTQTGLLSEFQMTVHSNFSQLVVFLCETLPKRKTSSHRSLFGNFGRSQILIILKYHEISGESWSGGRKFISGTLPSMNLRLCFHFVPTIAAGTFKPVPKKSIDHRCDVSSYFLHD